MQRTGVVDGYTLVRCVVFKQAVRSGHDATGVLGLTRGPDFISGPAVLTGAIAREHAGDGHTSAFAKAVVRIEGIINSTAILCPVARKRCRDVQFGGAVIRILDHTRADGTAIIP